MATLATNRRWLVTSRCAASGSPCSRHRALRWATNLAIRVTYFPAIEIDVDYHFRPPYDVLTEKQDQRTTLGNGTALSAVAARSHRPSINIRKRPPNIWHQL